ncbi:MAG: resistance-nodulation-cell division divalent metal cation efflux transporter CzcA [Phycisphaerae bacterium]|nr:MAG: resistance-nodulation-cell division divalent metal cation efflux transporter CzcA [Phycisphaerae bacterium]
MLNAIIEWSLNNRFIVIAASALIAITGVVSAVNLPVDAFPDTTPVQVQINTVAPTLAPIEIEQQITFAVEQSISGLKSLKEVRSLSKFGLSQVTVIFEDGVDIYFARQLVMERLGTVELPDSLSRPTMGPVATGLGEVYHYILTSQSHSLSELRTIQDWIIKPQLRSVSGVAEVNSWGGRERQYQVVVDPARLLKYDLTLLDLFESLERNNKNVGGGNITRSGESLLVQGVGLLTNLEQIENVVIKSEDGVPIFVRDLGEVVDGHEIRRGAVTYAGRGEAILGLGFMLMGENTRDVTERMKSRMEEIRPTLPDDVEVTEVYDRTALVDLVLGTVETNLLEGAILVVAVLFVFLGNFRAGLIVAAAIPLSMLFAANCMLQAGIVGSLMSLGAIDFGLIVDSSVIQIENSVRHLANDNNRRSRIDVVREAAIEVRKPTMFGELIIMIVYLPILTLEGIEGKMFRPMALTVVFALIGSLVLSLTLMPVLASLLLPKNLREREPILVRFVKRIYEPSLDFVLRHRVMVLTFVAFSMFAGIFLALRLGTVFIPRLSEQAIVINTVRLAGVSVDESVRYGTRIEALLLEEFPDEIDHIWSRTGTAEVATDPMGLELTDVFITLNPRDRWRRATTQAEIVEQMESELAGMPAMRTIFTQPIEMRVNEMVAGIRSDLGIKVFGDDFKTLKSIGDRIATLLETIHGASDITVEQVTGQPLLEVRVKQDQLARYGIAAADVLDFVASIGNVKVGEIRQDQVRFSLTVRLADIYRRDPERVGKLLIPTAKGDRLPLYRLAELRIVDGPSSINREWSKRRLTVQCNARGRDIGSLAKEVEERIATDVELPTGYFVRFGGQFEHLERAGKRLMLVVPLGLLLIFLLLYFTYGRITDVLRIFATLPLSAIGGIVALHLRDMPFSVSAGIGFVAMSGVSVLGDMVFVSFLRGLLEKGRPLSNAIREAALARVRPVLMTGLVASLGFVPMALNTGVGAEVQRPLATVVIGCVVTSTMLTLLALPVFYSLQRTNRYPSD